ncbi:asparagine synthase (glutamine-hydrolyzing) [Cesiribacter sp. SM1]|uniref:asparagine synthase (glutamine-hydrolyzing) n=1 Tax=Cesiribacter sp. SM1 TaxID=2861196 RepID=UPI001CD3C3E9|nr:asparagine synthase (glutamine-hydrolyzing) [Cesiribacter sp. SM1]
MCGLSLIIDPEEALAAKPAADSLLLQMQSRQEHRGPDSGGAVNLPWGRGLLALGSRRLQILGTTAAAEQPMHRIWGSKKGWLSYNGELYNYTELRNELIQQGCSFSSTSDTEVVLYALLIWGKAVLQRLNGMFALLYYEGLENGEPCLLVARDRWGQKPLYYTRQNNVWLAASELQGLLASGLVEKRLNEPQLMHYLQYKFAARPQTFFQNIHELEPGHYLLFTPHQQPVEGSFVPPAPANVSLLSPGELNEQEVLEKVEELLTDALLNHLQSDKPVGLFLSGGVDSTLMLALLREHAAWQLPLCFTLGNKANDASWGTQDYKWAEKAATQYQASHQHLLLEADTVLGRFQELSHRQDQPVADSAWITSCLLSEHAAAKVKVVLSGAGADELFAGYHRHSAFAKYLDHQGLIKSLLPFLRSGSNLLPAGRNVPGRKQWQLMKKFGKNLSGNPYQTFVNFTSLSILANGARVQEASGAEPLQWALEHDRKHYLVSDLLALNDKAGMQWGLEMRMPYLDAPLTAYITRMPATYLLQKGRKWILKALLQKYGGKAYTRRAKEGFGLPFGAWVQQDKTDFLWQWLEQKEHPLHEILPPAITQNLLQAHRQGRADYSQELMALALLAGWLEKNFG